MSDNGSFSFLPHQARSHVWLTEVEGERAVGKRPTKSTLGFSLTAMAARAGFRREVAVYKAASTQTFRHFDVPRLLASDERTYLLAQYVEHDAESLSNDIVKERTGRALAEFQTRLRLDETRVARTMLRYRRDPVYGIIRRSLGILRQRLGIRAAQRCMQVVRQEHRRQEPLGRSYVIHGDFSHANTLLDSQGRLYIIDFTTLFFSARWLLIDIVYYATSFDRQAVVLDPTAVVSYWQAIQQLGDEDLRRKIHPVAQMRFALLRRMLFRLAAVGRSADGRQYAVEFLHDVLLDDSAFMGWYDVHARHLFTPSHANTEKKETPPKRLSD